MAWPRPWRRVLMAAAVLLVGLAAAQAWREGSVDAEIARLARPHDVQMVSSQDCVFCKAAHQWFERRGVPFDECFIERDADCLRRYQAHGSPGTPLIFVRGQAQRGLSPPRIRDALRAP